MDDAASHPPAGLEHRSLRPRRMAAALLTVLAVGSLVSAPPASAATASVALFASRSLMTVGGTVRLAGVVSPSLPSLRLSPATVVTGGTLVASGRLQGAVSRSVVGERSVGHGGR